MLLNSESHKIGDIYISRVIKKPSNRFDCNDKDEFEIGIWNGDCAQVTLDELKQLRKFINDTIIKVTYKTK